MLKSHCSHDRVGAAVGQDGRLLQEAARTEERYSATTSMVGSSEVLRKLSLFLMTSFVRRLLKTSTGLYRSCAALASFSGTFDLILFKAVNFEFIFEKGWFGLVWIDGLNK